MAKLRQLLANIGLGLCALAIIIVALLAIIHKPEDTVQAVAMEPFNIEDETYHINGRSLAEFSDVIVEKFNEESRLMVSSVDASVSMELKQNSGLDIGILTKKQNVTYKATGKFYVDLSMMGEHSIKLDEDSRTITIEIPHAKMDPIEIDPTKFTVDRVENGLLAFGDLKFTPAEFNSLETTCKSKLENELNTAANRQAADERAVEEMMKIYEPVVKTVDDAYSVDIVFMGNQMVP